MTDSSSSVSVDEFNNIINELDIITTEIGSQDIEYNYYNTGFCKTKGFNHGQQELMTYIENNPNKLNTLSIRYLTIENNTFSFYKNYMDFVENGLELNADNFNEIKEKSKGKLITVVGNNKKNHVAVIIVDFTNVDNFDDFEEKSQAYLINTIPSINDYLFAENNDEKIQRVFDIKSKRLQKINKCVDMANSTVIGFTTKLKNDELVDLNNSEEVKQCINFGYKKLTKQTIDVDNIACSCCLLI